MRHQWDSLQSELKHELVKNECMIEVEFLNLCSRVDFKVILKQKLNFDPSLILTFLKS